MTPEQAIERVERVSLSTRFRCDRTDSSIQRCGECSDCRDSAALRLVIEAAKRPTALSEEEREKLANDYWNTEGRYFDPDFSDVPLEAKLPEHCKHAFVFGLRAALSLVQPSPLLRLDSDGSVTELKPEEPFTVEEAELMEALVAENEYVANSDGKWIPEGKKVWPELLTKLRAYIERRTKE